MKKQLLALAFVSTSLYAHYAVRRVHINSQIQSKAQLFQVYAEALDFPDYCNANWDSFEECLNDLSWLKRDDHIIVEQPEFPMLSASDLEVYLDILRRAQAESQSSNHPIQVVTRPK